MLSHRILVGRSEKLKPLAEKAKPLMKLVGFQGVLAGVTFGKEALLTALFGLGAFLDAYVLVNNMLIFSRSFFDHIGYSLLIPLYNEAKDTTTGTSQDSAEILPEQQRVVTVLFNYALLGSSVLALLGVLANQSFAQLLAPGWEGERLHYLLEIIIWLFPLSLITQSVELLRVLAIQQKRFSLLYLPRIIGYALFIALFAAAYPTQGWRAILWVLPLTLLFELILYVVKVPVKLAWQWRLPAETDVFKRMVLSSLCWLVFYLTLLVDNWFIAKLPVGEPGAFRYALVSLFILSNLSVGNIALLGLADLTEGCSTGKLLETRGKLLQRIGLIAALSVPIVGFFYWGSPWIIKLMYERGEFNAENTALVSQCFQLFLFLLPYEALWKIVNACFYALKEYRAFLTIGAVILLARLVMNDWGVHQTEPLYGLIGTCLANWYLLLLSLTGYLLWKLSRKPAKPSQNDSE